MPWLNQVETKKNHKKRNGERNDLGVLPRDKLDGKTEKDFENKIQYREHLKRNNYAPFDKPKSEWKHKNFLIERTHRVCNFLEELKK